MISNSDSKYKKFVEIKTREGESKKKQEAIAKENDETIVANQIAKRANSEGWETEKHTGHEHGIDLRLERGNHIIIIEAKGERPNLSQRDGKSRVLSALGQILLRMKNEKPDKVYRYCLAFPATSSFTKCEIPNKPRKQLGLNIFYVECSTGLLKVLLPNGKDAEDIIDVSNLDVLFHDD